MQHMNRPMIIDMGQYLSFARFRCDVLPGKEGQKDIEIKLDRPRLNRDAVPSTFHNLPSYLSSPEAVTRRPDPAACQLKVDDRNELANDEQLCQLKISSLQELTDGIQANILDRFDFLAYKSMEGSVVLYRLVNLDRLDEECPRLDFCIRVDNSLDLSFCSSF